MFETFLKYEIFKSLIVNQSGRSLLESGHDCDDCDGNYEDVDPQAIRALKLKAGDDLEDTALLGRLMAYCSKVGLTLFCSKV